MNKIFVIEGTDGSGKQTQTNLTYEKLQKDSIPVYRTSFPNYESNSSAAVKMYLQGEIAPNANDISERAASTFYAVDRYITYEKDLKKYYEDNKTVILLDRYVSSNLLHQGGKIIGRGDSYTILDEYQEWIENFEFNDMGIPRPTSVFFLYLPAEYSIAAMNTRKNKITNEDKKDIHESDFKHLENACKSGYYLAKKLGWNIIDCLDKDGNRKTPEEVNEEIYSILKNNLGTIKKDFII